MSKSLGEKLEAKIKTMLTHHRVLSYQEAKDGGLFWGDRPGHEDVFIKAAGMRIYYRLLDDIFYELHPKLKRPLIEIYGKTALSYIVNDLIRQKNRKIVSTARQLLSGRLPAWRIFYPVENIALDFDIDLTFAKIHAPGAAFYSGSKKLLSHYPHVRAMPYIEVECRAANEELAAVVGLDTAKYALSIIPSGSSTLILKNAPLPSETSVLVCKKGTKNWRMSETVSHRGVTFSSKRVEEVSRAKAITRQSVNMKHRLKEFSAVSQRVKNATIMFHTAKTVSDRPSKLLLLVSCLDTLLMERFYRGTHTNVFNKRLMALVNKHFKFSNREKSFFRSLYSTRSSIVHASGRHTPQLGDFVNLEVVVYFLILEFNQKKGRSQVYILKNLSIL